MNKDDNVIKEETNVLNPVTFCGCRREETNVLNPVRLCI